MLPKYNPSRTKPCFETTLASWSRAPNPDLPSPQRVPLHTVSAYTHHSPYKPPTSRAITPPAHPHPLIRATVPRPYCPLTYVHLMDSPLAHSEADCLLFRVRESTMEHPGGAMLPHLPTVPLTPPVL